MRVYSRLTQIKRAIQQAESQIRDSSHQPRTWPGSWSSFATQGIRKPSYGATPPELLLRCLIDIDLAEHTILRPDLHFVDLGSGLGMASFTAAQYFSRVTGFEFDPYLSLAAERIRQHFGIQNVSFRLEDFIAADLTGFDVTYFYYPFVERFAEIMGAKLQELTPGTVVISHSLGGPRLFPPQDFRSIYPRQQVYSDGQVMPNFFAYVRQ
ncbi:MAG: class I SAM-dependent methyltransferase [Candidatus Margulisbacteria bacterium]|nr:class I SAM-dependent methyltransferase [Candidatus Margulisiibacteriota bacterium]